MQNYKMGAYRFPTKTKKRIYNRKKNYNLTYKGKHTKKELNRRVNIAWGIIIMIVLIGTCHWLTVPKTIVIRGGGVVDAKAETAKQVSQKVVVDADNSFTTAPEINWADIPYIEKDKGTIDEQIRAIAKEQNFKWENWLVRLAMCESTLNPKATNDNGNHGLDRGLFQINNRYHWEVSDECAFDVKCSTEWTIKRVNEGYQHEWMCNAKI